MSETLKHQFSLRLVFCLTLVFSVMLAVYSLMHEFRFVRLAIEFAFLLWLAGLVLSADSLFFNKLNVFARDAIVVSIFFGIPVAYGYGFLWLHGMSHLGPVFAAAISGFVLWFFGLIIVFSTDSK